MWRTPVVDLTSLRKWTQQATDADSWKHISKVFNRRLVEFLRIKSDMWKKVVIQINKKHGKYHNLVQNLYLNDFWSILSLYFQAPLVVARYTEQKMLSELMDLLKGLIFSRLSDFSFEFILLNWKNLISEIWTQNVLFGKLNSNLSTRSWMQNDSSFCLRIQHQRSRKIKTLFHSGCPPSALNVLHRV